MRLKGWLRLALWLGGAVAATAATAQFQPAPSVVLAQTAAAQATPATPRVMAKRATGLTDSAQRKWSVYWGWNRSTYANADIHFWGADHDFTLRDVKANDLQSDLNSGSLFGEFLNPGNMTLPQTNLRLAYQVDSNTAWAINLDHMKYVVTPEQVVGFQGAITGDPQSGATRTLSTNYLNFEHTDGLNVLSVEYEKQFPVTLWKAPWASRWVVLGGGGVVVPKSNVTLNMLGRARNDEFHLAGHSVGVGAGWEADFWERFFFRTLYKVGYVNLPDVVTSSQGDRASHHFTYNELLIAFGTRF